MKKLNVAIVGAKSMGKAHSSAWSRVHRFFDVPFEPVLKFACGRPGSSLESFAARWGWESTSTDWKETVNRAGIDIIEFASRGSGTLSRGRDLTGNRAVCWRTADCERGNHPDRRRYTTDSYDTEGGWMADINGDGKPGLTVLPEVLTQGIVFDD